MNDENYLISPLASPRSQCFESACLSSYEDFQQHQSPYAPYSGQIHSPVKAELNISSGINYFRDEDPILFTDDGIPSAYLDLSGVLGEGSGQESWGIMKPSSRPSSSRRVSGGIAGRVAIFEGMAMEQSLSRPITPPKQHASSKLKV
jgi:hypothetical protein